MGKPWENKTCLDGVVAKFAGKCLGRVI
jgi:hypothetical protein